jgi:hypothetical protein
MPGMEPKTVIQTLVGIIAIALAAIGGVFLIRKLG